MERDLHSRIGESLLMNKDAEKMAKALKAIEDAVVAGLFMKLPDAHAHLLQVIDREKVVLREWEGKT